MPVTTTALWILLALAATVWAADWPGSRAALVSGLVGCALGAALTTMTGGPSPETTGLLVAALGLTQVITRRYHGAGPIAAGALAGSWGAHLTAAGAAVWLAVFVALVGPIAAAWYARRNPHFTGDRVRDEALLLLAGLGLLVATLPTVVEGWRSAATLAASPAEPSPRQAIPMWTMVTAATALSLGGLHAAWRRR